MKASIVMKPNAIISKPVSAGGALRGLLAVLALLVPLAVHAALGYGPSSGHSAPATPPSAIAPIEPVAVADESAASRKSGVLLTCMPSGKAGVLPREASGFRVIGSAPPDAAAGAAVSNVLQREFEREFDSRRAAGRMAGIPAQPLYCLHEAYLI